MTRATLLGTTTAILLPFAAAFAQSADTGAGVSAGVSGGATANAEAAATADGSTASQSVENAAEAASDAVGEAGKAVKSTAKDVAESTEEAVEDVANTLTPEAEAKAEAGVVTVADISGADVVDATGEVIGSVEMVVEQPDGKYAVIGVGGFLGIGEHDVAIPVSDLSLDAEGRLVLSGHTEDDLRQLPAFEADGAVELASEAELPELG